MGDLRFDENLLAEITHRLDLRDPNRDAIASVALRASDHYDVQEKDEPFECIVDSATGVGKTYVMAGLLEYFAGTDTPARNFLLLAPGRTIRDKSVVNFTPSDHPKSLTKAMKSNPVIITKDNFKSPVTVEAMKNTALTKLYVFTVQALTSASGDGRETHEYAELLGGSFFQFLAGLDDLVILADEHHCYRGPAFSKTIKELSPELVVGLTATPAKQDERLVAYRYPLPAAIHDKLVKTPIIVGRKDDRSDVQTKLLDGVSLLRLKEKALTAYCDDYDLTRVNPVMMVVAKDIAEATEFQNVLDSVSFDGGAWVGKTLLVHSGLTGEAKEDALAALEAVESRDSPVRIIISVGMLKEGWDVKNVYVIASMRASVSEVMTEQTLGRGMRLPFGQYTGDEFLDTVEVLAHEKYGELLKKRNALNEAFIDYGTYAALRTTPSGKKVVRQVTTETETKVISDSDVSTSAGGDATHAAYSRQASAGGTTAASESSASSGIVDIDSRKKQAEETTEQAPSPIDYPPLDEREHIKIPRIESVPTAAVVSLNDIDTDDYKPFNDLGAAFTTDYADDLKRTKIVGRVAGGKAIADVEEASGTVKATLVLDIPLSETRKALLNYVMNVPGVERRPLELGAARRIVDHVIEAMGTEAEATLSAYYERCGQRLGAAVRSALKALSSAQVTYNDRVELIALDKTRRATKRQVAGHPDGGFDKLVAFDGWKSNLYSHAWFDTNPEYRAASAIDASDTVVVWARLHRNDVPIKWSADGREYNPDFVVIEEVGGKRIGWLVETKMNKEMTSEEVVGKRKAARKWANTVNSAGGDTEWRYLLLSETDVEDSEGSWPFMKSFGS